MNTKRRLLYSDNKKKRINRMNSYFNNNYSVTAETFENLPEPQGSFSLLIKELRKAIDNAGYKKPSAIQEEAIPHILNKNDIIGCAQTGTGKTAAFALPIVQLIHQSGKYAMKNRPRALIITPTRELAAQIGDNIRVYCRYLNIRYAVVFGGVNQNPQVNKLQNGVDILVATPGRLLDLINQKHIYLDEIELFVLDEADRMLDMGFFPDINKIISKLPEQRQSLFFSATVNSEIKKMAQKLLKNPVSITISPEQPAVERIIQKIMFVEKRDKDKALHLILQNLEYDKILVFTDMKHLADKVSRKLNEAGIKSSAIHGNKSQFARTQTLSEFRSGKIRVLVATDIAARGIDVSGITHVINYCLPNEAETYVHRIGRTARADSDGQAISFCSSAERNYLRKIEILLKNKIATA